MYCRACYDSVHATSRRWLRTRSTRRAHADGRLARRHPRLARRHPEGRLAQGRLARRHADGSLDPRASRKPGTPRDV